MSTMTLKLFILIVPTLLSSLASAQNCNIIFHDHQYQNNAIWLKDQSAEAEKFVVAAIGPEGASPGAVMASPTRKDPNNPVSQDYFFHWKRDAALTLKEVYYLWVDALDHGQTARAEQFFKLLDDYAKFSRKLQLTPNMSGPANDLGVADPKFHMDGTPFTEQWTRPQIDGPALEATTLMAFATKMLELGKGDYVKSVLFDPDPNSLSVIRVDLDVTAKYWTWATGNVWEDKNGDHFFTRMAQRRALKMGAIFADKVGDSAAATKYRNEAQKVDATLDAFFDPKAGYIRATINPVSGVDPRSSLDAEILLAILHSSEDGISFSALDDRVLATIDKYVKSFENLYGINKIKKSEAGEVLGLAVGRYQEDTYDGYGNSQGNPWFITTLGMAEFHHDFERALLTARRIQVTALNVDFLRSLGMSVQLSVGMVFKKDTPEFSELLLSNRKTADGYIQRVKFHAGPKGHLSEQFNRDSGIMQGVDDLTWSNDAVLSLHRSTPTTDLGQ